MQLSNVQPPPEVQRAFEEGINAIFRGEEPLVRLLRRERPGAIPVYTLGLEDILQGRGLEAAVLAAWRFVADDEEELHLTAEVSPVPGHDRPLLTSYSLTTQARELNNRVRTGLGRPEARGKFEERVLRIPAVLVEALWLKAWAPEQDVLVPTLSADKELRAMESYSREDFTAALERLAPAFLGFDKPPQPTPGLA